MGFAVPGKSWFVGDSQSARQIRDRLLDGGSGLHLIFNRSGIEKILATNNEWKIWPLLFLDEWLIQNFKCIK